MSLTLDDDMWLESLVDLRKSRRTCKNDRLIFQDEITEMKRKLKIMNHQIDQLKEEITTKEAALVKVNLDHTRLEKEKEALKVNSRIFIHQIFVLYLPIKLASFKKTLH